MIRKLVIRNYALIDSLDIDFAQGFSVITGETGAGKSIILGALSLILGQRVDTKVVTDTAAKTLVEGTFDVAAYHLKPFFEENDLEYDDECIIRREIAPSGKSRAFINDTPVTVAQLKQLGDRLIDIHSQHQNLLLADSGFQLRMVDVLAGNTQELAAYQEAHQRCVMLAAELATARQRLADAHADEDYIRFQYAQLQEARLVAGEQEELEVEQERLTHAGDIKEALYEITSLLEGNDMSVLAALNTMLSRARSLHNYFPDAQQAIECLDSAYIDLKDLNATFADWNESLAVDPERLAWVEERLDTIFTLQQKHRVKSVDELIALRDDYAAKLNSIDNSDADIEKIERQLAEAEREREAKAKELTATRTTSANKLSSLLVEELRPLGMPHVQIAVDIEPCSYYKMGAEQVVIRFSANKNQALQPVSEVASGGEISRLMLSIKSLVADALSLPTIIFDEIDTGVSGDIAARMGAIMRRMSQYMQVIAITHLPQVAAIGNRQYRVYKDNSGDSTHTHLVQLNEEERVEEIARMLSGTTLTEAALNNARVLLASHDQ
ncbi:MAG: DNA repair protein RecN [Bacteroidaceae bacterium]|nr:DNA repair protein RecN [Bacteroidaceae bacterium]